MSNSTNIKKKKSNYLKVSLSSYDSRLLDSVVTKMIEVARINLVDATTFALPTTKKLFNILKSPFIYKTTRDQYHKIDMKRVIYFYFKAGQSIDIFRNVMIPAGIEIKIV